MSLNNNNPVNNEGQGSSNGSGNRASDKSKEANPAPMAVCYPLHMGQ